MLPEEAFELLKSTRNRLFDIQTDVRSSDEWHAIADVLGPIQQAIDDEIDRRIHVGLERCM